MSISGKSLALALSFVFLFGCAGPSVKTAEKSRGVYHLVKKGETLWSISHAYHKDILDLVVANKITDPNTIGVDSVIFIPGADHIEEAPVPAVKKSIPKKEEVEEEKTPPVSHTAKEDRKAIPEKKTAPVMKAQPAKKTPERVAPEKPQVRKIDDDSHFIWPVRGAVTARFGIQPNGLKHNGIRISAKEGTPVSAAAGGEVMFASLIKYYGETIIIKHDGHYSTVYTFLKNKRVKVGDRVKKGERIASIGRPENGNVKPCLNFEIRQNNRPRNPLLLLPQ